jgi:hypothetical protein
MSYMRDSRGRRLDSFAATRINSSNVGTRLFGGRMTPTTLAASSTFQVTTELATEFDAVRPLFANTDQSFSRAFRSIAASVISDKSDLNNSSGTWTNGKRAGLTRVYAQLSPGVSRISYMTCDWIPVSSIPRTDGGDRPLVVVRAYFNGGAGMPMYGDGTDDFTNWATRTDGRMWAARSQAIEAANTPTNFTSTTNISQSPIVGVQYLARGRVVTVLGCGDSITEGRGTYLNEGFIMPAVEALSTSEVAFEYGNAGWSGQSMLTFAERAIDILQSDVKPDVLVMPVASPNDTVSTITDANIAAFRSQRSRVLDAAKTAGVPVVLWTWLPTNTSVRPYGAADALRVSYNAEVLALASKDVIVVDTAAAISGITSSGQVQMLAGATTDNIHPNDTGNALLTPIIQDAILDASQRVGTGSRIPSRAPADVEKFQITDTDAHVTKAGIWVYAGTSAGSWTIQPIAASPRADAQVFDIVVRDTAGPLTISRSGGDFFFFGTLSPASITVLPGQTARLSPASANGWQVSYLSPAPRKRITVQAGATYAITPDYEVIVATGTTATWTLPALAGLSGVQFVIKNRGSGDLTVQRAGADQIYDTAAVSSITVAAGAKAKLINDGTYWLLV